MPRQVGQIDPDDAIRMRKIYETGGVSYKEIANMFGVSPSSVKNKAHDQGWISEHKIKSLAKNPERLKELKAGPLKTAAEQWRLREEAYREKLHTKGNEAMDRFWASNPTPTDFAEAERLSKLIDRAFGKDEGSKDPNLAILINGPVAVSSGLSGS